MADEKKYTEKEIKEAITRLYESPNLKDMLEALLLNDRRTIAKMRLQIKRIEREVKQRAQEYLSLPENRRLEWLGSQNLVDTTPSEAEIDAEEQELIADENARIQARMNENR